MIILKENITAVVLAGGKGRRFAGKDKGLIEYKQCPIIEHVIRAVAPQVSTIMINANRNKAAYASYGYPVITDALSGFQGPLAGFSTAMENVTTEYVLTLPCDGPFVSAAYVQRMADKLMEADDTEIAVAHDGARLQPVHALIPVKLIDSLKQFMDGGERKIDCWYAKHNLALVDFSDTAEIFKNINTLEELQALEGQDD